MRHTPSYSEKISKLESQLKSYEQTEDQLKLSTTKIEQLNNEIKSLQDKFLKDTSSNNEEYNSKLNQLQADHLLQVEELKKDNQNLQDDINNKLSELEKLNASHLEKVANFNQLLLEKEQELEQARLNEQQSIQNLNDDFEKILIEKEFDFNEKIKKLNSDLEKKLTSISEATGDLKSADETNQKLRENIEVRDMQLTDMNNQVKSLVDANTFKQEQNDELTEKIARLSLEAESNKGEYERNIEELNLANDIKRQNLIEDHERNVLKLAEEHNSEIVKLQEIYEAQKLDFDQDKDNQLQKVGQELIQKQEELNQKSLQHQQNVADLSSQIKEKEQQISKLTEKNEKLLKEANDLEALNAVSDDSNKRQLLEVEILQGKLRDLENEIKSLDFEKEKQLKELVEEHDRNIENYKSEMEVKYEGMLLERFFGEIFFSDRKKSQKIIFNSFMLLTLLFFYNFLPHPISPLTKPALFPTATSTKQILIILSFPITLCVIKSKLFINFNIS